MHAQNKFLPTSLRLDPDVKEGLREAAHQRRTSQTKAVNDALRLWFAHSGPDKSTARGPVQVKTSGKHRAEVELLLEILDGPKPRADAARQAAKDPGGSEQAGGRGATRNRGAGLTEKISSEVNAVLTPEDEKRIYEEELKRAAEDAYREKVRAEIGGAKAKAPGFASPAFLKWAVAVLLLLVVVIAASKLWPDSSAASAGGGKKAAAVFDSSTLTPLSRTPTEPPPPPPPVWTTVNETIIGGQITVPPGQVYSRRIEVPTEGIRNYHVTGRFDASGGSGNDIYAALMTEDEFLNFANGHRFRAYYSSGGQVTTGSIDVRLPPGRYALGFSNKSSIISQKFVETQVEVSYEKLNPR